MAAGLNLNRFRKTRGGSVEGSCQLGHRFGNSRMRMSRLPSSSRRRRRRRIGLCKLCQTVRLLCFSHIISNFALRDARGTRKAQLAPVWSRRQPRRIRDQTWDQEYLLCAACERLRKRWEDVVAATLAGLGDGREARPDIYHDNEFPGLMVRFHGMRYAEVKLWVLSTLYLMHHATGRDWRDFHLLPEEELRIGARLRSGNPGADLEYQILGTVTARSSATRGVRGGVIAPGWIVERRDGFPQTRMAQFWALDVQWLVFLGDWPDNPAREARLREDGSWRPLVDRDFESVARAAAALDLDL